MATATAADVSKLRWACRRGMLELDLLLNRFLDNNAASLSFDEKQVFEQLLSCNDQELFAWLIRGEAPENKEFSAIIKRITTQYGKTVC